MLKVYVCCELFVKCPLSNVQLSGVKAVLIALMLLTYLCCCYGLGVNYLCSVTVLFVICINVYTSTAASTNTTTTITAAAAATVTTTTTTTIVATTTTIPATTTFTARYTTPHIFEGNSTFSV